MLDEVNASTQIKVCLEKMSKCAALPFTIFRLGSRDFLLFIMLYSCVTDRWWHIKYDENIKIVGGKTTYFNNGRDFIVKICTRCRSIPFIIHTIKGICAGTPARRDISDYLLLCALGFCRLLYYIFKTSSLYVGLDLILTLLSHANSFYKYKQL